LDVTPSSLDISGYGASLHADTSGIEASDASGNSFTADASGAHLSTTFGAKIDLDANGLYATDGQGNTLTANTSEIYFVDLAGDNIKITPTQFYAGDASGNSITFDVTNPSIDFSFSAGGSAGISKTSFYYYPEPGTDGVSFDSGGLNVKFNDAQSTLDANSSGINIQLDSGSKQVTLGSSGLYVKVADNYDISFTNGSLDVGVGDKNSLSWQSGSLSLNVGEENSVSVSDSGLSGTLGGQTGGLSLTAGSGGFIATDAATGTNGVSFTGFVGTGSAGMVGEFFIASGDHAQIGVATDSVYLELKSASTGKEAYLDSGSGLNLTDGGNNEINLDNGGEIYLSQDGSTVTIDGDGIVMSLGGTSVTIDDPDDAASWQSISVCVGGKQKTMKVLGTAPK
jgi:hypothetical protein